MTSEPIRVTYLGGPTALLEVAGFRFPTDPTFDPAGTEYPTPAYTLHKKQAPALALTELGHIDAVLGEFTQWLDLGRSTLLSYQRAH